MFPILGKEYKREVKDRNIEGSIRRSKDKRKQEREAKKLYPLMNSKEKNPEQNETGRRAKAT